MLLLQNLIKTPETLVVYDNCFAKLYRCHSSSMSKYTANVDDWCEFYVKYTVPSWIAMSVVEAEVFRTSSW